MSFKQNLAIQTLGLFGKTVTVQEVIRLSPSILRVRFESDDLRKLAWSAGDKIKLLVEQGALRSYTPSFLDRENGWMDIIIYLHGKGPGSQWAEGLQKGERSVFFGPSSSIPSITTEVPWASFFGDETTLGLADVLYQALPTQTPFSGFIEMNEEDLPSTKAFSAPLQAIQRQETHGKALLEALESCTFPEGQGMIWLSGEAGSVLALRKALLQRGFQRSQLLIKPYWSLQGKAHRKKLERGELRAGV